MVTHVRAAIIGIGIKKELHGQGAGITTHKLQRRTGQAWYGHFSKLVGLVQSIFIGVEEDLDGLLLALLLIRDSCIFKFHLSN